MRRGLPLRQRLITRLQNGLPLVAAPYAAIAEEIGTTEQIVMAELEQLRQEGIIKRFGVVVRHHELGYSANAMAVWDVPDHAITALGRCLAQFEFVTLCYRRARQLPHWRYNLYCMVHGHDRETVLHKIEFLKQTCDLERYPHQVLFSLRRFKQRGARYLPPAEGPGRQQEANKNEENGGERFVVGAKPWTA